jgi:hypothetical protein
MDAREKEARRMIAVELFEQGELRDSQIAGLLGVGARAVNKWHKAYREGGRDALGSSGPPGARGLLDPSSAWSCGNCCGGAPKRMGSPPTSNLPPRHRNRAVPAGPGLGHPPALIRTISTFSRVTR